jgi:hypothetical protein
MRLVLLAVIIISIPLTATCEELSDVDMRMIVELADGVWKGDVVSVEEKEYRGSDGELFPYRNAKVLVRTADGSLRSFRASKIDDDWRLDEEEIKRLDYVQELLSKYRELKSN